MLSKTIQTIKQYIMEIIEEYSDSNKRFEYTCYQKNKVIGTLTSKGQKSIQDLLRWLDDPEEQVYIDQR